MTANVFTWVKNGHPNFGTPRLSLYKDTGKNGDDPYYSSIHIYRNALPSGEDEDPFILETPFGDRYFWSLDTAKRAGYELAADLDEFGKSDEGEDKIEQTLAEIASNPALNALAAMTGEDEDDGSYPEYDTVDDVIEDDKPAKDFAAWAFFGGFAAGFLVMLIIAGLVPCA